MSVPIGGDAALIAAVIAATAAAGNGDIGAISQTVSPGTPIAPQPDPFYVTEMVTDAYGNPSAAMPATDTYGGGVVMGSGSPFGGVPNPAGQTPLNAPPLGYEAIANDISPQPRGVVPPTNPFASSGLPVNESLLANLIFNEPQLAISMGGAAQYGTPGYWNLAGMEFDPYSIFLASGGNVLGGPTEYLQFAANLYNTMGTVSSEGGGVVNAGALLRNMVTAPADSQLGMMFSENPEMFYQMAVDVATGAGMSPLGVQSLKLTLGSLYNEYMTVSLLSDAGDLLPFHTWIAQAHPEVVASWGG